jgi:hypothetical protein
VLGNLHLTEKYSTDLLPGNALLKIFSKLLLDHRVKEKEYGLQLNHTDKNKLQ